MTADMALRPSSDGNLDFGFSEPGSLVGIDIMFSPRPGSKARPFWRASVICGANIFHSPSLHSGGRGRNGRSRISVVLSTRAPSPHGREPGMVGCKWVHRISFE